MPFACRSGVKIYWRLDGRVDAPAVLLLNSLGTDLSMWDRVVPLLHHRLRIVRMDTRGHGASDVPDGDFTVTDLAEDSLCVLDAADIGTASVCGLSLGGMIALELAVSAPDRIEKVIACNTSAAVPAQPWIDRAATVRREGMGAITDAVMTRFFSEAFRSADDPSLATTRSTLLGTSPAGYAACCMAISRVDLLDRLSVVDRETLVINGKYDEATPAAEHGDRITEAVPHSRTVTLDAGHISAIEQPEAFAQAVLEFLLE